MKALRSFAAGIWAMMTSPLLLLVLWLANLIPALILAGLFFTGLMEVPMRGDIVDGGGAGLDWAWWVDFRGSHGLLLALLRDLSGWIVLAGLLVQTFLLGGVLEVLDSRGRRFTLERFGTGAARYFGAFFWLLLLELALLTGLDYGWNGFLGKELKERVLSGVTDERWALAIGLIFGAAYLLLFFAIRTVFDYARVRTVVEQRASFFLAFFAGVGFVFRHLWSVFVLSLFFGLLFLGLVVLTGWGSTLLGGDGLTSVLLLLLLHQVFLILRVGFRIGDYTAKLELFRKCRQEKSREGSLPPLGAPATQAPAKTQ